MILHDFPPFVSMLTNPLLVFSLFDMETTEKVPFEKTSSKKIE
jgi:hypothetical protein